MQPDLKKRILANILLDSRPEHFMMPRSKRITPAALASLAIAATAAAGLVLLILSKLRAVLH